MKSKKRKWRFLDIYTTEKTTDLGLPYLDRIYLVECPLFSILLQRIGGPDPSTDYHDHPWMFFLSFIIVGRYVEAMPSWTWTHGGDSKPFGKPEFDQSDSPTGPIIKKARKWFNFKWANDFHTIIDTYEAPVISLLFCGPRKREWGFLVDGVWMHYKDHRDAEGES